MSGFGAGRATRILRMQDYSSTTISMLILLPLVAVFAVLGNGFVLGIIARFKRFRIFPNILIANLALIDLLSALINVPMYLLWGVLGVKWFTGKVLAIISLFMTRLCLHLNFVSMLVLLVNVFLAIALDLKYFTWKTNEKAVKIALVEWMVCVIATVLLPWFDSSIDLQEASVYRYRRTIFIKSRYGLIAILSGFTFATVAIGVLIYFSIQRKKGQRKRLNLPRLQAEARLQLDIQAAKNVLITVLAFLVCYIPPLFIAILGPSETDATNMAYPLHIAFLFTFLSSGINPVILCFRAKRFRRAVKQLLQDPFGKTTFQETEKEQRAKQIGAYKNQCEAEKGKVRHDLVACSFKTYTDEMSLGVQSYKKKKKIENAGIGRRTRSRRNQTTPFSSQDSPPQINSPVAWVDHYPADTAGKSSEEGCSTSREDYTQDEITLEVHQEPSDHFQCKTGKCRKSGKAP